MSPRRIIFFIIFFLLIFFLGAFLLTSTVKSPTIEPTISAPTPSLRVSITTEPKQSPTFAVIIPPTATPEVTSSYTVVAGDTLQSIALRFGVDLQLLAIKNQITDVNLIYPNQVLLIPEPQRELSYFSPNCENLNSESCNLKSTHKRILIILSEQKLYAYDGDTLLASFLISSGVAAHPTVTGDFNVWIKLSSTRMTGDGYDIPNVLWTMYFYNDYGIHAADWHNNFGVPMSHGCINMRTEEADWLFHWAEVGTPVKVIP